MWTSSRRSAFTAVRFSGKAADVRLKSQFWRCRPSRTSRVCQFNSFCEIPQLRIRALPIPAQREDVSGVQTQKVVERLALPMLPMHVVPWSRAIDRLGAIRRQFLSVERRASWLNDLTARPRRAVRWSTALLIDLSYCRHGSYKLFPLAGDASVSRKPILPIGAGARNSPTDGGGSVKKGPRGHFSGITCKGKVQSRKTACAVRPFEENVRGPSHSSLVARLSFPRQRSNGRTKWGQSPFFCVAERAGSPFSLSPFRGLRTRKLPYPPLPPTGGDQASQAGRQQKQRGSLGDDYQRAALDVVRGPAGTHFRPSPF